MASASFRDSLGSLGWARRDQDVPVNTAQQSGLMSSLQSLNPFQDRGYVQLPTTEGPGAPLPAPNRREEEEGWFVCESTQSCPPVSADHARGCQCPCLSVPCEHSGTGLLRAISAALPWPWLTHAYLAVSRWDRLMIFGACNLAALACFVICFALFPVLSLRPTKFVILYVFRLGAHGLSPNVPSCKAAKAPSFVFNPG